MTADETKDRIRGYLRELLRGKGDNEPFSDSEALYLQGRIDSLNLIELIGFLEVEFGLDLSTLAFDPSVLDSVDAIVVLTTRSSSPP